MTYRVVIPRNPKMGVYREIISSMVFLEDQARMIRDAFIVSGLFGMHVQPYVEAWNSELECWVEMTTDISLLKLEAPLAQ